MQKMWQYILHKALEILARVCYSRRELELYDKDHYFCPDCAHKLDPGNFYKLIYRGETGSVLKCKNCEKIFKFTRK